MYNITHLVTRLRNLLEDIPFIHSKGVQHGREIFEYSDSESRPRINSTIRVGAESVEISVNGKVVNEGHNYQQRLRLGEEYSSLLELLEQLEHSALTRTNVSKAFISFCRQLSLTTHPVMRLIKAETIEVTESSLRYRVPGLSQYEFITEKMRDGLYRVKAVSEEKGISVDDGLKYHTDLAWALTQTLLLTSTRHINSDNVTKQYLDGFNHTMNVLNRYLSGVIDGASKRLLKALESA